MFHILFPKQRTLGVSLEREKFVGLGPRGGSWDRSLPHTWGTSLLQILPAGSDVFFLSSMGVVMCGPSGPPPHSQLSWSPSLQGFRARRLSSPRSHDSHVQHAALVRAPNAVEGFGIPRSGEGMGRVEGCVRADTTEVPAGRPSWTEFG